MSEASRTPGPAHPLLRRLMHKNVLAGLMFIAIASLGLWLSRDYPIGTLRRMSTGFMPQMLCWLLMGLGGIVLLQGLLTRDIRTTNEETSAADPGSQAHISEVRENYWSIAFVALSLVAFALTIETLGLVVAIIALVVIASFAYRGIAWWETIATAIGLTVLCWLIFVLGIGMTVKILPGQ